MEQQGNATPQECVRVCVCVCVFQKGVMCVIVRWTRFIFQLGWYHVFGGNSSGQEERVDLWVPTSIHLV